MKATKSWNINRLFLFIVLFFIVSSTFAQNVISKTDPAKRLEMYQKHTEMVKNSMFKNLPFQFVGPTNISGRMTDVEVVSPKGKNYTIYVAGASGGIWKTENEGITWEPIFEHAMSTAIGDLALDPQNQNILWAGTGEANIFRSSQAGAGIYRSKDAGKTWEHRGLINTNTISRIIVHPENSDIVFVAAGGHEWTNNEDRGIFKTIDGGKTWENILYIDEKTGANDLVMDPSDPDVMYASMWQRIRKKWNDPRNELDYTGSGILKTIDGGETWAEVNSGLPKASYRGRIGIDLCKAKPNVLYAFVDNYQKLNEDGEGEVDSYGRPSSGRIKGATVYRSNNAGESWEQVSQENNYMERMSGTYGWVFSQIRVDPVNEDKIYVMGLYLNVSEDGGKTFYELLGMHMDHHGLWIDMENTDYLVNVNDGGVAISYDGKNFRTFFDNLPLVQFFNVGVDMSEPFYVYGSIQDHGSFKGKVDLSKGRSRISPVEFEYAPGGEGSNHVIDPTNTNIVYSAGFYGSLNRTDLATGIDKSIMPPVPEGVESLRGQWMAPFIISPHNPRIIYHGTQFLHRSMNMGESWEKISPDLTYNVPEKKGDIPYQTIFSISESPFEFGLIYAGTDDGRVWTTKDSGKNWEEINKGLPIGKWVSEMVASQYDKSTVYMTQNGKRDDDMLPYVWKSYDYGKTWVDISKQIPSGPVNVIKEDPFDENILYVGTDYGVYISLDKGESWESLAGNLPTTYVHDLVIHPRDEVMVIGTHGRGVWALDLQPIHKISKLDHDVKCKILAAEDAIVPPGENANFRRFSKDFVFTYYLHKSTSVIVEILDSEGEVLKQLPTTTDKGINIVQWNLNLANDGEEHKFIDPGTYKIRVKGNGFEEISEFKADKMKWD